ncbi:lyase family protein [Phaeobacter sp.]|uniref:lyase family protein n=1 Tax=Phaeobacter sp. TaxID=1902409 RepID=UPI0025CB91EA|nr:lyase family protein [Phaeobacter sp.]
MAASLFDSALYADLFPTGDVARLFSDSAEIRAMLLVEGALAKAQGARGDIPADSAAAIGRAVMEVALDPGALRRETGQNGVVVPALLNALREEMNAPEHAQYVHWGATSQDIIDTALMLRLRQALGAIEGDVASTLTRLQHLAEDHADLPMAGRTYGQIATPTSFGAVVAAWGYPLLALLQELPDLRRDNLWVSLSGAAGTASALGRDAAGLRADLAAGLALGDPGRNWHGDRTPILRIADWLTRLTTAYAKLGEDVIALRQSGIAELDLAAPGASSTMPQKQNPIAASVLVALAPQAAAQMTALHASASPQHQRDGAHWFGEWLALPQLVACAASAARTGQALVAQITPNPEQMSAALGQNGGGVFAEALSFALCQSMRRPEAQAAVKNLCKTAQATGESLHSLASQTYPDLPLADVFAAEAQLGQAPQEARAFATACADHLNPD